ncbi:MULTISPECIES: TfoX/Sxy family protein [Pseudovibrio]|uniref:TfoX/Sxy family protein n=1 Tax=Stappiaceae TaxID=2821832 RepID=UPI0023673147|nr:MULTISPECIES: TfoX/Sxy family protein [Pseudovibrio]MDD7908859.1 TfoX/Sxy family protein [Pseudovibrio exalbescens]MDX5593823.1 TfoX/Sxy family protein [Pseudovibrio sp. SPO723]
MTVGFSRIALNYLKTLDGVRTREMFGGTGIFHEATMFGLVKESQLYLRAGCSNVADYLKQGQTPYIHKCFGSFFALPYYSVPHFVQLEHQTLKEWAEKAKAVSKNPDKARHRYFAKWTEFNVRPVYEE